MADLGVLLEEEKDNTKSNRAHPDRGKTPVATHKRKVEMKLKPGGNIAQIKSYWEILGLEIEIRIKKVNLIILTLQCFEKLLPKLPASKRAKIQPCFSSLYAEVEIAISKITNCMKIKCDENQSRLSFLFHELATTLEAS
ncbi:hypothetical protein L1987_72331 [Smallanthus sonchifolius]|uniref:Uncharacterized protein n=1 Tax=Smallanthus sonchifolius TaxID=185202 RepID=A0ACB9AVT3_9ASTR|nr:hypothetical protein L1987_72331 [Smallanthus sonchifolius]